jgi:hypothetical protein
VGEPRPVTSGEQQNELHRPDKIHRVHARLHCRFSAVVFLALPEPSFIAGQSFAVNGGRTLA